MKLYLLEADSGKCKVGVSGDIITRLKGLESAGGFKIVNLFYVELGENAYTVEQAVHRTLRGYRELTSFNSRSEWFTVSFTCALAAVLQQVYKVGLWVFPPNELAMTIEENQLPGSDGHDEKHFTTGFVSISNIEMLGLSETVELPHAIVTAISK